MTKTAIGLSELKEKIYGKAKSEKRHRFWGLYVHICKGTTLHEAYREAKANDGSPGIDGLTFEMIEEYGVGKYLEEISEELKGKTYRPAPNRRVEIPKDNGKKRRLGIPNIKDRIVQGAVKQILEPIFEADFCDCSYGYRPGRSQHEAVSGVGREIHFGKHLVLDVDLSGYFDNVRHHILFEKIAKRVKDDEVMHLIKLICKANGSKGVPQGGVISPLLSNVYLQAVDEMFTKAEAVVGRHYGTALNFYRFADDMVCLVRKQGKYIELMQAVRKRLREELEKLQVTMNEEKTKEVDLTKGETFGFLGFEYSLRKSNRTGKTYAHYEPKRKKVQELAKNIMHLLRTLWMVKMQEAVNAVNQKLRGWVNYFRIGHSSRVFNKVRNIVINKLLWYTKRKRQGKFRWKKWSIKALFDRFNLYNDYQIRFFKKALPS
jgi:RNA-directed DNA polymerase